ncbi:hypothetical protein A9R01_07495 ['Osedax' symbiont bacterium Rs2_46_30_T18]|nr:hypothetical protein A9R01_07495 ['Osedax' symbiont bacterium Rs2_46_30_T18]
MPNQFFPSSNNSHRYYPGYFAACPAVRLGCLLIIALLSCSGYAQASELEIKYKFVPIVEQSYQTSVVSSSNKAPLSYTIVDQNIDNFRQVKTNVQVVAARNYYQRIPQYTSSDMNRDKVFVYVVGLSEAQGYSQHSKLALEGVYRQIDRHKLKGCAPLSLVCSRTASNAKDLSVQRDPLQAEPVIAPLDASKKRQQLKP